MNTPRVIERERPAPALHEFEPFPLSRQDDPDHRCSGDCACQRCGRERRERAVHLQPRDRRRPKP